MFPEILWYLGTGLIAVAASIEEDPTPFIGIMGGAILLHWMTLVVPY